MAFTSPTRARLAAIFACGVLALGTAAQGKPAALVLQLRALAQASGSEVLVGDIAAPGPGLSDEFARLSTLAVAPAPRPGEHLLITRAQVQSVLGHGWRIEGAAAATVTRSSQQLAAARLCEAAIAAANRKLSGFGQAFHYQVACRDETMPPLLLPSGPVDIRPDLRAWQPSDGVQRIPVDLVEQGDAPRRIGVALDVQLEVLQWCAVEAGAEGDPLAPSRFARCWRPSRHPAQALIANADLPTGRLGRAMREGETLQAHDIVPADAVLAGDRVTVRCREGAVELEEGGELEQSAHVGDAVRVRVGQAPQPVVGRLVAQRIVELESQP